ncbi:hypothetical protein INR49_025298 [Caranx melampygus]|nr:hypothetical protein INR49_025298 [Caranx melampygus]
MRRETDAIYQTAERGDIVETDVGGRERRVFPPVALLCCAACPVVSCVLRPTVLRFSHVVSVCHCPRGIGLTA